MSLPTASPEPLLRPAAAAWSAAEPPRRNRLSVLLGRATGRRGPSVLVRETAALQLEERRAHWGYSRPVVALDVAWNLAFAVAAAAMLASTLRERPNVPIRLWVVGYALQCVVHAVLVWVEYRRRSERRRVVGDGASAVSDSEGNDSEEEEGISGDLESGGRGPPLRFTKRCESINTMVSFIWWTVGFYWVVSGGEILLQNAPKLYWLAVVFLAFDVFFAILCVALACLIGIALCCCLPCIIAILYAVAGQEGASDADINVLPRYKFVQPCTAEDKTSVAEGAMIPIGNNSGDPTYERLLLNEDAECCICLTTYEDGVELHALPCNHHFHSMCITKWLRINATCPLCKYNILKGNE